ncbi:murein biosynthesis integral membrane protein MurJ [Chlamydia crocodili]|uniref:Murein biosynthesis integral membrane protein MurJ n=1 Tax=Chlamydia crocodili TaxID=2766982 RepID=A0ABX8CEV7_9CHLA|nr:murein biosynthesis integral membrane protein MurJ [Chlamydia crocodili]QVE49543.1 murein biosynthesis integral membrane protein MurJ [Chlamydia crocodili]
MNKKDGQGSVASSLFNLLSGTFFSRVTGMLREIVMAAYFGADPLVAAFWLAFRTIFFLRKILGGPILGLAFIPHFEFLRAQDTSRAAFFFKSFSRFFCLNACVFTLVIEMGLGTWLYYAHGNTADALQLTMILLPSGIFLMMYTVNSALLHCEKRFLSVGLAPAVVNVLWILTVFLARHSDPRKRIVGLSVILVIGFILEWFVTVPGVRKFLKTATTLPKERDSIKALIAPLSLGLLSMGVFQINLLTDMCLARYIHEVGPLYLMYSIRIQQLPVHLFGLGVFTVLLPSISRCVQEDNNEEGYELMKFALNLTVSVMVIMTMGLLLLALPGVRVLYEHGLFPTSAVHAIVQVLRGYSGSIIPMALIPLISVLFYARRHYTIPLVIGIIAAIANMILNVVFGCWLIKHVSGLAYATSLVSWAQLYFLWQYASKKHPTYSGLMWITFKRSIKVVGVACLAFTVTLGVNILTHTTYVIFLSPITPLPWSLSSFVAQSAAFFSESVIFLAFLFGFAKLLRVEDLVNLTSFQYWKGRRSSLHNSPVMQDSQN